jgi:hypothetical protein
MHAMYFAWKQLRLDLFLSSPHKKEKLIIALAKRSIEI